MIYLNGSESTHVDSKEIQVDSHWFKQTGIVSNWLKSLKSTRTESNQLKSAQID